MRDILFRYDMNPTTWAYLSSLLTIGIYFKFRRFWSVRNLDLLALIAFCPGLLLISYSHEPPLAAKDLGPDLAQSATSGSSAWADSSSCGCCWIR